MARQFHILLHAAYEQDQDEVAIAGGLAAGLISYLWEYEGARRPRFIVVEPEQADCLLQSAIHGRASRATGSVDFVMAGLAFGETLPLAWKFLETSVDHFMTIEDGQAIEAMRTLAAGSERDVPIVAGESGTAGLAALQILRSDPALSAQVGLDAHSRVLIVSTEGATAPKVYEELVGEPGDAVLKRQAAWSARYRDLRLETWRHVRHFKEDGTLAAKTSGVHRDRQHHVRQNPVHRRGLQYIEFDRSRSAQ